MKLKSLLTGSVAGLAALAVTIGCSNPAAAPSTSSSPASGATASSTATAATTATPQLTLATPAEPLAAIPSGSAKKKYVIRVSLLKQDDDFYKALKQGLEDEAAKENVTMEIESADLDASKQADQVQDFTNKGADAIVLCPVDSDAVGPTVGLANKSKIPVFTADVAAKSGTIVCHIASDNVEGGRLAGEYAAKLLNGKGNVAILDHPTVSSVADRVKGFKEALAKFPDIKIVDDEDVPDAARDKAVDKATNLLSAHPEVNLIFGINDNVALGTLSALQQVKNDKVMVVGFDAGQEAQTNIASGTSQLKADAIQFPHLIGVMTVDSIVKSLNGEKVPASIPVPTGLVTKDSFAKS